MDCPFCKKLMDHQSDGHGFEMYGCHRCGARCQTLEQAINHTRYWNGDSGLQSSHHPNGARISLKMEFYPRYSEHLEFTINGNLASYAQMPRDGWLA